MIQISRNKRHFNISDLNKHKDWWVNRYPEWELSTSEFMETYCDRD